MTSSLSDIRHQLSEEIQLLIKAKDLADNESDYDQLNDIIKRKKKQFQDILECEFGENQEEYKIAIQTITESLNDVRLALEGVKTMASALKKSTKALRAVGSLLKLIT